MPKKSYPLCEPRPYYMSALGMQGARFIDGVPDPVPPVTPPPAVPAVPAQVPPKPDVPPVVPPVDVAELQAQLATFQAAEAKRTQEAKDKADAELSDLQKAQRTIAELSLTNDRNAALAAHPVPAEYQALVQGTDAASFLASAKLASELAAKAAGVVPPPQKPGVVPQSGSGAGGAPAGGSLEAGADLYNSRHKKTS